MEKQATKFAPAERLKQEDIFDIKNNLSQARVFIQALNLFPEIVLVLNSYRQIVYANEALVKVLGVDSIEAVLGKRPGEAFGCICSSIELGGCGTSEFCRECGAVNAILKAQTGSEDCQECRITAKSGEQVVALDLKVWAIPVTVENLTLTFFVIKDIADQKRRENLERYFFHDLLNDASILQSYSENVKDGLVKPEEDPIDKIHRFSVRIIDAVKCQKDLLAAERGKYTPDWSAVNVRKLLEEIVHFYRNHSLSYQRILEMECSSEHGNIRTDRVLLWRVLINLVKNALEASELGQKVVLGYYEAEDKKTFFVNNPSVMTDEVKHQVFQRSFSTKDRGRGLGTYSVKLFTESYLKGKVWFESVEGLGTTFFVQI